MDETWILSHCPGKESPRFMIKIFWFQPPGLCSHHFFYIKYPLSLDLVQSLPPLKPKNKTAREPPLACSNKVFLPPSSPDFSPLPSGSIPTHLGLSLSFTCFQALITLECYRPSLSVPTLHKALWGQVTSLSHQHHPAQGLDSKEVKKRKVVSGLSHP